MGTPEFAVPSLKNLLDNGHNIVGVITSPDRKSGRGQKVHASAVKKFAQEKGLKILQPEKFKDEAFLKELKSLDADLQIVVAFRMLPEAVWAMPPLGTINLHGSLLPDYRGAAPINWAIINGDEYTGVSTFFIEKEIDTGNVIKQRKIAIGQDETAGELHDRMMHIGAQTLLETVEEIVAGTATRVAQDQIEKSLHRKAPKIFKEDCEIKWTKNARDIHNFIRGLSPYPTAWTTLNEKKFKIFKGKPTSTPSKAPGEIVTDNKTFLHLGTQDFDYAITELQMQGKKRMGIDAFLRGYNFEKAEKQ